MLSFDTNRGFSAEWKGSSYASRSGEPVNSNSSSDSDDQWTDALGSEMLSIALIGPDEGRRRAVAQALAECNGNEVREFASYPPSLDDMPRLLEQHHDVVIVDLDSDPEYTLELVENLCANGMATAMVYSAQTDSDLLVRCMRAGAREFLTVPMAPGIMAEALVRATARRSAPRAPRKASGRLLVFMGAKGGVGTTTLACNMAVALAKDANQSTLLIDLNLPLGDAALNLGILSEYSTVNALEAHSRLDASFLSKLLVKHSSGAFVLASPGKFLPFLEEEEAIDRLLTVARQEFENVVVDVGTRLDLTETTLFREASVVYLVTQAGVAELRNANRLITQFFGVGGPRLEIVLNRDETRSLGVSDEHVTKALTRPVQWKIPNEYSLVRRMQNEATPLVMADSSVSRMIRKMARAVTGQPEAPAKKKGFSLFG